MIWFISFVVQVHPIRVPDSSKNPARMNSLAIFAAVCISVCSAGLYHSGYSYNYANTHTYTPNQKLYPGVAVAEGWSSQQVTRSPFYHRLGYPYYLNYNNFYHHYPLYTGLRYIYPQNYYYTYPAVSYGTSHQYFHRGDIKAIQLQAPLKTETEGGEAAVESIAETKTENETPSVTEEAPAEA